MRRPEISYPPFRLGTGPNVQCCLKGPCRNAVDVVRPYPGAIVASARNERSSKQNGRGASSGLAQPWVALSYEVLRVHRRSSQTGLRLAVADNRNFLIRDNLKLHTFRIGRCGGACRAVGEVRRDGACIGGERRELLWEPENAAFRKGYRCPVGAEKPGP